MKLGYIFWWITLNDRILSAIKLFLSELTESLICLESYCGLLWPQSCNRVSRTKDTFRHDVGTKNSHWVCQYYEGIEFSHYMKRERLWPTERMFEQCCPLRMFSSLLLLNFVWDKPWRIELHIFWLLKMKLYSVHNIPTISCAYLKHSRMINRCWTLWFAQQLFMDLGWTCKVQTMLPNETGPVW